MAAIALASALLGMNRIVKVLGSIGPVAIVFLIIIALAALLTNWNNLSNADAAIAAAGDSVVRGVGDSSSWWIVGAVMYVAYNILAGVPFISKMGTEAASQKEAILGGLFGGVLLGLCAFCLNLAMLATYSDVSVQEVPALQFATMISPVVGIVFAIVLLVMIYNTVVPMIIFRGQSVLLRRERPRQIQGHHRGLGPGHVGRRSAPVLHAGERDLSLCRLLRHRLYGHHLGPVHPLAFLFQEKRISA